MQLDPFLPPLVLMSARFRGMSATALYTLVIVSTSQANPTPVAAKATLKQADALIPVGAGSQHRDDSMHLDEAAAAKVWALTALLQSAFADPLDLERARTAGLEITREIQGVVDD